MGSTTFGALFEKAKSEGSYDDVIPDGDFVLECVRSNAKSKKGSEDSIGLQWKVVGYGGEDAKLLAKEEKARVKAGEPADAALGSQSWINLYFTEKAAAISFRQLKSFGFSDDFLAGVDSAQEIADACLGIKIDAEVGHRNWGNDGENVNNTFKVHEIVAPPAVGAVEVDPVDPPTDPAADPDDEPF